MERTVSKDPAGNKITMRGATLYLYLAGHQRPRKIAVFDRTNMALVMTRKSATHLLVKANAYGFNHHVLQMAETADTVHLSIDSTKYEIPIAFMLEYGSFLHFKKTGFEKQIFLTEAVLEQFKVA